MQSKVQRVCCEGWEGMLWVNERTLWKKPTEDQLKRAGLVPLHCKVKVFLSIVSSWNTYVTFIHLSVNVKGLIGWWDTAVVVELLADGEGSVNITFLLIIMVAHRYARQHQKLQGEKKRPFLIFFFFWES